MARIRAQQPVLPSLLDRLIDDDPEHVLETVKPTATLLDELRQSIRRDLENLLNTRIFQQVDLERHPELEKSVLQYGLPDFSTVLMGSEEHRENFRLCILETINRFETRLRRVDVALSQRGEAYERTLYLKITAVLMVEPDPIPMLFDSRIHAMDRMLKLKELRHG